MSHNIIICVWILGPCCPPARLLVPTALFCVDRKNISQNQKRQNSKKCRNIHEKGRRGTNKINNHTI